MAGVKFFENKQLVVRLMMEERLAKTRAKSQIYKSAKDKRYPEEVISKNGLETINSSNKREVTPTKKKVTFITSDKHKN